MTSPDVRPSHTFVVPAFGEPPWLERCVASLAAQSVRSTVLIATPTPNPHIAAVASRIGVPVAVNARADGIAPDWNFALAQAATPWVTLAHQDDWYEPDYVEACLAAARGVDAPLLVFTDATETLDGDDATLLNTRVKRAIANSVFLTSRAIHATWRKQLLLSFGNPIPCPSVMIHRAAAPDFRFPGGWKSNLDWSAWYELAARSGAFVYVGRRLVHRTMHVGAATTRALADRASEDDRMFRQLWPAPIAVALSALYAPSRHLYSTLKQPR